MPSPKGVFAHTIPNELEAPSTMMMFYYSAQIHLRKVLNRVHTDLYKAEGNKVFFFFFFEKYEFLVRADCLRL